MGFVKPPQCERDAVVHVWSGSFRGDVIHEFANVKDNYYALVWANGPSLIMANCQAWAGDNYGSGSLYPGSIYSNHHVDQDDTGMLTWYPNGYEGPPATTMSLHLEGNLDASYPYYVEVLTPVYGVPPPADPADVVCPPDALWPYRDLTPVGSPGGTGGVISHRRIIGGPRWTP
jgi:hypothetical protein